MKITKRNDMKIKLRRHYCQLDNGPRVRCWYSRGSLRTAPDAVTIYAKTYCDNLSDVFPADRVENDTDTMTDYFEKDRVRILPGDPLWDEACAMAAAKKV
jgi:hypothetical protein